MKKSETIVIGKIIKKYKIPLKHINELNKKYDSVKNKLNDYGDRLAGRLDTELNITSILQQTSIYPYLVKCMTDYINDEQKFYIFPSQKIDLDIFACWINDMVAGEYNPPHTHHNGTGWSVVLFLQVPNFINDVKHAQKFRDGQLVFIDNASSSTHWMTPVVGDFYIFRADQLHGVMPFKTKTPSEIRRSMSFNFILKENV